MKKHEPKDPKANQLRVRRPEEIDFEEIYAQQFFEQQMFLKVKMVALKNPKVAGVLKRLRDK